MFKRTRVCAAVLAAIGGGLATAPNLASAQATERVEITGSRILKLDLQSASPLVTVTAEEIAGRQDVTLETFLNTLPQVNPAGTTTSNNPGNNGQANIDLRGLGSNRNIILIDGRRAMVSAADQTVDVNSIPMALVDSIEVITGGAGAVYGADAVSGVVNVKLKRKVQGITISAGTSNATEKRDAREDRLSIVAGNAFDGGAGGATLFFDYAKRDGLIKSQRSFAAVATSTTSYFPEGSYRPSGANSPSQAAIDALYSRATYRQPLPGQTPASDGLMPYTSGVSVIPTSAHGFNTDGSLFTVGTFNNANRDVRNWRYPIDSGVNTNIFPDVYSYNFDAVNILVLPMQRYSLGAKLDFTLPNGAEVFGRLTNTRYTTKSALAPTPTPTVDVRNPALATATQARSNLVVNGRNSQGAPFSTGNSLVVPVTNPFIPTDLATLLASRGGDDLNLVGAGASEPFLMRWRTLGAGLREANYTNSVFQGLAGAKGDFGNSGWSWETSASLGNTKISNKQTGNIDTQRLQNALEAADGGASLCTGGVNPFGRQPLSASCAQYLNVDNTITTTFQQTILQGFVTGDIVKLPAGAMSTVVGAETRRFEYALDPGTAAGPISGFNTQSKAGGKNNFTDVFGELQVPLLRKAPFAESLDLSLAARTSQSKFTDTEKNIGGDAQRSNTFALNLTWQPTSDIRARTSLQRAARAPNFGELFDGGGSAPQYFDPCSATSVGRTTGPNAAQLTQLCTATGVAAPSFVQTPGSQSAIDVAGNTNLKPEIGTSFTAGLVFSPSNQSALRGLTTSVDYYQIQVKDAILTPDVNEIIADCYNYYGRNPGYSATNAFSCQGIFRAGGDILQIFDPNDPTGDLRDGAFQGTNGGKIKTSGLDFALGWRGNAGPGQLSLGLNWTYLLSYKQRSADFLPEKELAGTVPYFGAGLGQAFPKNKLVLSTGYDFGPVAVDARYRWFSAMENRMAKNFPGENFTGTQATGYVDVGVSGEIGKNFKVRVGVNNLLDQEPRTYAPNVQSGTDPSTFDVIGRRLFLQGEARF